jgi:hypothetical protein
MIGGDSNFSGGGMMIGRTSSVTIDEIGCIFASILMRDCAWLAFDALARKRSTKACRCARCASCFFIIFWSSTSFSLRRRSKSE